jgi:hypothetical protein
LVIDPFRNTCASRSSRHAVQTVPAGPTRGLAGFDQRIDQYQLAALAGCEVVGRSFGDVADHSGAQLNAAPVDAQPPATFENVADNVFVVVVNLFTVGVSVETKGDETSGKLLLLEAAPMTDLGIEFGQLLESVLELDDFHN